MSRSKGFAYTTFALLSATILMSIVFTQVYQPESVQTANAERIGEASFFMDSVLSDMDRSLSIATRRSLTGASNYIINTGEPLSSPADNVSDIMVNGTLDGNEIDAVENASLAGWAGRVSKIGKRSGYQLDISVVNHSFDPDHFSIDASFEVKARLFDPTTLASFNRTRSTTTDVSIEGIEDTMITLRSKARYTRSIERCSFDDPAEKLYEVSQNSSTTAHGEVVINPSDGQSVDDQGDKMLVVEDPDSYDYSYTSGFDGVIAAQESSSPGSVNTDYALGTGSIEGFSNGTGAVIDSGKVWRTGFVQMFDEGCYVPSERGPGFLDRLGNDISGGDDGIATLIHVGELPDALRKTDSAVGHVYFDDSDSDLNEIKGVSDEYSWFRIDDDYVSEWGLSELVK